MMKWLDYDHNTHEFEKLKEELNRVTNRTLSNYVKNKLKNNEDRRYLDEKIVDYLSSLKRDSGRYDIDIDDRSYVFCTEGPMMGIEFVIDKHDFTRYWMKSLKEPVANKVLEELGAGFRLSYIMTECILIFSEIETYEKIERGHLSEFEEEELDELIYNLRNYANGEHTVSTKFGTYDISIVRGILEKVS